MLSENIMSKRVLRQSGLWELSGGHCVQSLETGVWVSPAGEDGRVELPVGSVELPGTGHTTPRPRFRKLLACDIRQVASDL